MNELELIGITEDGQLKKTMSLVLPIADQAIKATVQLYRTEGYEPPWIGYLAFENGTCVGTCGFKSPPRLGKVEIAYFTFPGNESRGVASRMAAELVRMSWAKSSTLVIAAQTLPEESASTSILKKLKFRCAGTVSHPEDGLVWEWHLNPPTSDSIVN